MQTIYLVKAGEYEDVSNILSFYSKDSAEEFVEKYNAIADAANMALAYIEEDTVRFEVPDAREFFTRLELTCAYGNCDDYDDEDMVDYLGAAL